MEANVHHYPLIGFIAAACSFNFFSRILRKDTMRINFSVISFLLNTKPAGEKYVTRIEIYEPYPVTCTDFKLILSN